jgi:hypothetical protein
MGTKRFSLQRPELVAFVLANCFMVVMKAVNDRDNEFGFRLFSETEAKLAEMCRQLRVPQHDQEAIKKLCDGVRELIEVPKSH